MRRLTAVAVLLCLLGWLGMACRSPRKSPTRTPLLTATLTPTPALKPTHAPSPTPTPVPSPTPGVLTDAQAIALVKGELTARGIALDTAKITIAREPRQVLIRYSSAYAVDSRVFQAQTVLVALATARIVARLRSPTSGGMRLAVVPDEEGDVGLQVSLIEWSSLEAWADGSISDQEFVSQWTVGEMMKE